MSDYLPAQEMKKDGWDWKEEITGGALEDEGIFGFSVGFVAAVTNFTVGMASAVTSAALDAVSNACNVGRLLTGSPASTELCITQAVSREMEAPIVEKVAAAVPHIILNVAFPVLISPTFVIRMLAPNFYCEANNESQILSLQASSTSDYTFYTAKSHDSVNSESSWDEDDPDVGLDAVEESKSATAANSSLRTDRTSSLSTLSESSGATSDGYDEFLKFVEQDDARKTNKTADNTIENELEVEIQEETCSQAYYLNFSALLEEVQRHKNLSLTKGQNGCMFYVLRNSSQHMPPLRCVLDILVQSALSLARDDSANIDNKCPVWKPEGDTKKTLQQMHKLSFEDRTNQLAKTVLKWTGVLKDDNEEIRLIKTRGIVNMSPLDLKDLLIDCSRGHLVNKNSLGKRDVCKFECNVGTTTIVENTMKIPFVGGELHSVSLTHSRFVENDPNLGGHFYVIVSKSVQLELDKSTGLPYYSVSVLRPVGDDATKTDLVNVAQISEVPVPRFMVNKIAFSGALDFFCNLRSI
ncbi:hypothetical protein ACHAWO_001497 [Cyclotella atomus]|uniref:START domain-containing protein n=1 Tax=Cyclotella atomus TaxID=382360 RepID=A0ABD3QUT6_9STRA